MHRYTSFMCKHWCAHFQRKFCNSLLQDVGPVLKIKINLFRSWMEGRSVLMIFSAYQIVCCSLALIFRETEIFSMLALSKPMQTEPILVFLNLTLVLTLLTEGDHLLLWLQLRGTAGWGLGVPLSWGVSNDSSCWLLKQSRNSTCILTSLHKSPMTPKSHQIHCWGFSFIFFF